MSIINCQSPTIAAMSESPLVQMQAESEMRQDSLVCEPLAIGRLQSDRLGESVLDLVLGVNSAIIDNNCTHCGKRFNKRSHLNRHIRQKHQQTREYTCQFEGCGKAFKRGSHLKRHTIKHTREKNFKCLRCIMEFGYKHHLDRHIKLIHERDLFSCQECGSQFSKRKGLAKHMREHERVRTSRINKENKNKQHEGQAGGLESSANVNKTKKIKKEAKPKNKNNSDGNISQDMENSSSSIYEEFSENNKEDENTNNFRTSGEAVKQKQMENNCESEEACKGQQYKSRQSEVILYKCDRENCLRAYKSKYSLKLHIKKFHLTESDPL